MKQPRLAALAIVILAAAISMTTVQAMKPAVAIVATPAAGECPYVIPYKIFEDIADHITLVDDLTPVNFSAFVTFDLADEEGRTLPSNQVNITGDQLYELTMGAAPVTSLPKLPSFDYPVIYNQDRLYTDDACYRQGDATEPAEKCPYLFPAVIFKDIAESVIVGTGLKIANARVGVQYELANRAGVTMAGRSQVSIVGGELYEYLISDSQMPVTDLPELPDDGGPLIGALEPNDQEPCYD